MTLGLMTQRFIVGTDCCRSPADCATFPSSFMSWTMGDPSVAVWQTDPLYLFSLCPTFSVTFHTSVYFICVVCQINKKKQTYAVRPFLFCLFVLLKHTLSIGKLQFHVFSDLCLVLIFCILPHFCPRRAFPYPHLRLIESNFVHSQLSCAARVWKK